MADRSVDIEQLQMLRTLSVTTLVQMAVTLSVVEIINSVSLILTTESERVYIFGEFVTVVI